MSATSRTPIVIMGGFLSRPAYYREMSVSLRSFSGLPVTIVPAGLRHWLLAGSAAGWSRLLGLLDRAVHAALEQADHDRAILVGHSSGGIFGRLYMSPEPFRGRTYAGLANIDCLVTLGSPHYNVRGARMRRWVESRYPGAFFSNQVRYVSIAGRAVRGDNHGPFQQRLSAFFYRALGGSGASWGDGLVPVDSALLQGSEHVVLDGIFHAGIFGRPWYGSAEAVRRWWRAAAVDTQFPAANEPPPHRH
jgi:pimeloyl-ACP methyl ester carboxylesterase